MAWQSSGPQGPFICLIILQQYLCCKESVMECCTNVMASNSTSASFCLPPSHGADNAGAPLGSSWTCREDRNLKFYCDKMRPSRDALKPCGVSSGPQMDLSHAYKGTQRLLYIYEVRATLIPSLNLGTSHSFWEQLRVRRICVHKRELWRLEQKNGLSRAWWTGSLTFSGPDSFIYWLLES